MLLAIDIGNTNTHMAVFCNDRIIKTLACATKKGLKAATLKKLCLEDKIRQAIIVSVVPSATKRMEKMLKRITGKKPYIIGKNIKVPMPNLYRGLLGQDRLVNAYAASRLYGAPAIVIDLGTAITIDAVSRDKKYLGGLILPGMELSLEALHRHTALLPKLRLKTPAGLIGRDTAHSILSGIVYGFAGLCDELARKIKNKVGKNAIVIATGGNARLIKKYSREINRSEPLLTFKGLGLIYDKGRALS